MLKNSFIHIPSIGKVTEEKIWKNGIITAEKFLNSDVHFLPSKTRQKISDYITSSRPEDPHHYYNCLPSSEQWRIFKRFQKSTAYLDIETTGLDFWDQITTIALYDGDNIKYYVNGQNLDDFKKDIFNYQVIVTYNGKTFDIPFIERFFNIEIPQCHLDLRYILKSLGYSGGLKSCEKQFGINRGDELEGVDGFIAVLLWDRYQRKNDKKALETLLAYNIEDVLNLEYLMITAYNMKIQNLPFELEAIKIPPKKDNPFEADKSIINIFLRVHF